MGKRALAKLTLPFTEIGRRDSICHSDFVYAKELYSSKKPREEEKETLGGLPGPLKWASEQKGTIGLSRPHTDKPTATQIYTQVHKTAVSSCYGCIHTYTGVSFSLSSRA